MTTIPHPPANAVMPGVPSALEDVSLDKAHLDEFFRCLGERAAMQKKLIRADAKLRHEKSGEEFWPDGEIEDLNHLVDRLCNSVRSALQAKLAAGESANREAMEYALYTAYAQLAAPHLGPQKGRSLIKKFLPSERRNFMEATLADMHDNFIEWLGQDFDACQAAQQGTQAQCREAIICAGEYIYAGTMEQYAQISPEEQKDTLREQAVRFLLERDLLSDRNDRLSPVAEFGFLQCLGKQGEASVTDCSRLDLLIKSVAKVHRLPVDTHAGDLELDRLLEQRTLRDASGLTGVDLGRWKIGRRL